MSVGHVFVVSGDIRALASDAWILPTDSTQHISSVWKKNWSRGWQSPAEPDSSGWDTASARRWPDWPDERSTPWLGNVAGGRGDPTHPARCADRWLDEIAAGLKGTTPRHGRSKHLVALPALGTGSGGHYSWSGDVLKHLLPTLRRKAEELDIDLVLVARDADLFAAARAVRAAEPFWWPELGGESLRFAKALGERAGRGEVVLFLGAGASAGAGLPDWSGLLADLARQAKVAPDAPEWKRLSVLDQASILQRRLRASMNEEIAARFTRPEAALQHFLLASMPVSEAITTNYDDLFELASGAGTVSVLPHAPSERAARWLLKMHGCVGKPADIVLTREDYLRYEQRRVALAGIVQAMLLTRHMLFVGFSLNDDNFHKVADAVRRARDPAAEAQSCFGTVLKLEREPYVEELWRDELDFVSMGAELFPNTADDKRREIMARRARKLEIFLDCLLAHTPIDPAHFLGYRFSGTLSTGETVLRDELAALIKRLPEEARRGPAWESFCEAIRRMGGRA